MLNITFRDKDGQTWHQVTKRTARRLYEDGQTIKACAANMRPGFPWYPEIALDKELIDIANGEPVPFDRIINQFEFYNCTPETGTYARFYAKEA